MCNIDVVVEVPMDSRVKYELDDDGNLRVDRILHNFPYWFNYGEVPKTLGGDGDPLDVIILGREKLAPRCYIKCKLIGVLKTEDEKGIDDKLICYPADDLDIESKEYNDINDISKGTKERLKYFFEHYKETENGKNGKKKCVIVKGFDDKKCAEKLYEEGCVKYKEMK